MVPFLNILGPLLNWAQWGTMMYHIVTSMSASTDSLTRAEHLLDVRKIRCLDYICDLIFCPSCQVAKVQEELKKEKERTGNVSKMKISAIKKRYEKDSRVELDKHKEMFRAALTRAQMSEKKLQETGVELAKFKDMNLVATRQIKVLNHEIDKKNEDKEHVLQALNKKVRDEKEVLQAEKVILQEQNKKLCHEKKVLQTEMVTLHLQEKLNLAEVLNAEASLSRHLEKETIWRLFPNRMS